MKRASTCLVIGFVVAVSAASIRAWSNELPPADETPAAGPKNGTVHFVNAAGKTLGSVTIIGGTTYYIGPDGATLATSTIIDGRRVFKTY